MSNSFIQVHKNVDTMPNTPIIKIINSTLLLDEKYIPDEVDRLCELVVYYIQNGFDVNSQNKNGETALMRACRSKHLFPVVKILLEAGAGSLYINGMGNTALDEAIYFDSLHSITMLKNANRREYTTKKPIKL